MKLAYSELILPFSKILNELYHIPSFKICFLSTCVCPSDFYFYSFVLLYLKLAEFEIDARGSLSVGVASYFSCRNVCYYSSRLSL